MIDYIDTSVMYQIKNPNQNLDGEIKKISIALRLQAVKALTISISSLLNKFIQFFTKCYSSFRFFFSYLSNSLGLYTFKVLLEKSNYFIRLFNPHTLPYQSKLINLVLRLN